MTERPTSSTSPCRDSPSGSRTQGEKPFRAQAGVPLDPPARRRRFRRDDGPREVPARPSSRQRAEVRAAGDPLRAPLRRRHGEVALRCRRRQRHRDRLHPRGRSRHAVRVVAGGLRAGLQVLLDRPPGLQPRPRRSPRSSARCGWPIAGSRSWAPRGCLLRGPMPMGRVRREIGEYLRPVTNVVMMGMGEPLNNFVPVVDAMEIMLDDHGYGLSRRRVTLSTSGVVPNIRKLKERAARGARREPARAQRRDPQPHHAGERRLSRSPRCWKHAATTWRSRRATSSPSST